MNSGERDADALEELYWRSEILQVLYWMRGEGLGTEVSPESLSRFLTVGAPLIRRHMACLAREGFVEEVADTDPRGYRLTERGIAEGGRSFHDEFADLIHRGHGECSDDCWCHDPAHAGESCPGHSHQGGHA